MRREFKAVAVRFCIAHFAMKQIDNSLAGLSPQLVVKSPVTIPSIEKSKGDQTTERLNYI